MFSDTAKYSDEKRIPNFQMKSASENFYRHLTLLTDNQNRSNEKSSLIDLEISLPFDIQSETSTPKVCHNHYDKQSLYQATPLTKETLQKIRGKQS